MGKPRMIILVRHAQSEGNKNRDIHQFIPDHRVKLTQHGYSQAEEAGRQLRSMLKPDDTLQFFTSPYRRTRETTEGILRTLTSDDPTPSPFPRHKIKVFEEPRLREQDFGNFQPCSAEMERMWQERADYGHFFYRIPNGESAADAYDRISGFNESMWRQFGDEDFPSVCVLVTHGLMTRVFLMKWYHWSVEYFEDLRNVNHCEFIIMKRNEANGKYILQNELRTWSDLKRRAAATGATNGTSSTPNRTPTIPGNLTSSPTIPVRRWGGCANGCNHDKMHWPRRAMRKNTMEYLGNPQLPAPAVAPASIEGEKDDHPIAAKEAEHTPTIKEPAPTPSKLTKKASIKAAPVPAPPLTPASPNDASNDNSTESDEERRSSDDDEEQNTQSVTRPHHHSAPRTAAILRHLQPPAAAGEGFSDDSDYFPGMHHIHAHREAGANGTHGKSRVRGSSKQRHQSKERKIARKMSEKSWKDQSGMGSGARADALGDGDDETGEDAAFAQNVTNSPTSLQPEDKELPILREALKGDMIVENKAGEEKDNGEDLEALGADTNKVTPAEVDRLKEADRKGFGEIY